MKKKLGPVEKYKPLWEGGKSVEQYNIKVGFKIRMFCVQEITSARQKNPNLFGQKEIDELTKMKYVVLARRTGSKWYVAGMNGTQQVKTLQLSLPMFAGQTVQCYIDQPGKKGDSTPVLKTLKVDKKGIAKVAIQPMGGVILVK